MRLETRYTKSGRQVSLFLCSLIVLFILAGCGKDEAKIRVGVSIAGNAHPDFRLIKSALDENAEKYGARIVYERERLLDLLVEGIDVLILNNSNLRDLESAIKETHRKNIPVVILDSPLPRNLHVEAYIKENQFDAGKMAADYVVKRLNGKGNVIVLEGPRDDEISRQITLGMYSVLERHEAIRIVVSKRHPNWDVKLAENTVQTALKKYAGNIQAVLAGDSQLAMAAVKAISRLRLADKIVTVGIGADLAACEAIIAGAHDAEVDRMPYGRGQETLYLAASIAEGKEFPYDAEIGEEAPKIKVKYGPLRLITKENVSVMERAWPQLAKKP